MATIDDSIPPHLHPNLLDVWVDDVLGRRRVGTLERIAEPGHPYQARVLFHYADGLADPDSISLLMPIRRETYQSPRAGLVDILLPIFDQNLPEGTLRAYLIQRYRKVIPDLGDFDLLGLVGHHVIGRVRIAPHGMPANKAFDTPLPAVSLRSLLSSPDSMKQIQALFEKLAPYSGVSGVQPKILLPEQSSGSVKPSGKRRLTLPVENHIVKAAAEDFPWLAINEHLCLYAASMSKVDTVRTTLSDDGRTLAIDRFDRDADGHPLGFEDACCLAGLTSSGKYSSSYESLISFLIEFLPDTERASALEALFRIIALNCLMENGDAHLKNFGLIYDLPNLPARLAPAFDLVCTTAYMPEDQMALTLNGKKRFPTRATLTRFGRTVCQLSRSKVEEIYLDIATGMEAAGIELEYHCETNPDFAQQCGSSMKRIWTRNLIRFFNLEHDWKFPPSFADLGDIAKRASF